MRMTKFVTVVAVMLAGCGGGGDECQRFFDKTRPLLEKMAKENGKSLSDADAAKFVEKCRQAKKDGKEGEEEKAMTKCVLDANGEAAIAACMAPAFGSYMKKSKKSEADLQLNKLGKMAKLAFIENSAFPTGTAPLTPAESCCKAGTGGKCTPNPADWKQPAWEALDFQIDEPHYFRYSVESDGKKLVAKAVGDLDCDTTEVTYTLNVTSESGNPTAVIAAPTTTD